MSEIPRKFVSLSVAYVEYTPQTPPPPPGTMVGPTVRQHFWTEVLGAVADDGTTWVIGTVINGVRQHEWLPVKPLPPRIELDG